MQYFVGGLLFWEISPENQPFNIDFSLNFSMFCQWEGNEAQNFSDQLKKKTYT